MRIKRAIGCGLATIMAAAVVCHGQSKAVAPEANGGDAVSHHEVQGSVRVVR